ncbi:hypothetical protein AJ80_02300 [Polytolypa hystricis UAMH7299]|uniref:F-box domain-containing protein n=1 Tax=Polytolypa hystricis (strain UAMH7299) TaxID=1447883 RepID=A0A2B7YHY2_POLH7|nr:hypothetical protein AJ80_02300 [Polytolypa hystricis UAMH7299]
MTGAKLPPEIIHHILSIGNFGLTTLAKLARVNSKFNVAVRLVLYRNVCLMTESEALLFDRSIKECPELGKLTKSVRVIGDSLNPRCLQQIGQTLRHLPSLKTFFYSAAYYVITFDDMFKGPTPFQLQSVDISSIISFDDVAKYFQLSGIEILRLAGDLVNARDDQTTLLAARTDHHQYSLKQLTLDVWRDYSVELDVLLLHCPLLESFSYTASDPACRQQPPLTSPAALSQVLGHCKQTLTTLELAYSDGDVDGTRVDLSCLQTLRNLKAHSCYLFQRDERNNPAARTGFYARLPSSLEKLEIIFMPTTSAFEVREIGDIGWTPHQITAPYELQNHNWLVELMSGKKTYLRNLSHIHVKEITEARHHHMRFRETMKKGSTNHDRLPSVDDRLRSLENTFRAADITLELDIRDFY